MTSKPRVIPGTFLLLRRLNKDLGELEQIFLMVIIPFRVVISKDNEIRMDLCCLVKAWDGLIVNREPSKHEDPKWYAISKFPDKIIPYVKQAIANIEKRIVYTQTFC